MNIADLPVIPTVENTISTTNALTTTVDNSPRQCSSEFGTYANHHLGLNLDNLQPICLTEIIDVLEPDSIERIENIAEPLSIFVDPVAAIRHLGLHRLRLYGKLEDLSIRETRERWHL
jgi:hypothetical protein